MRANQFLRTGALLCGVLLLSWTVACTSAGTEGAGPTINHIQIAANQPAGQPVAVTAQVTDPDGVESVAVFYQAPHAGTWDSAALTADTGGAGTYVGEIPGSAVMPTEVWYYLEATDKKGVTTRYPATAPTDHLSFTVNGGDDMVGPVISHVKVADGRPTGSPVIVSAKATDDTGVASVTCYYRAAGATDWIALPLTAGDNNGYQGTIPGTAIVPEAVEYYLEAIDTTALANTSTLPLDAPASIFTFTVAHGDEEAPTITHTPIANGQPESRPVAVIARIEDLSGVARATVYYRVHDSGSYTSVDMDYDSTSGQYSALIPGSAATSAGVDYYIEAEDEAPLGNVAVAPDTAPSIPYTFTTAPESCVVPPFGAESFEGGIFPGWWRTYSAGTGCEWTVSSSYGHDGTHSASHSWDYDCDDLLVLPCLDLTGLQSEGLVVDFWQRQSTLDADEVHTFEWALDNPDPSVASYTVFGSAIPQPATSSTWAYHKIVVPPSSAMLNHNKVYFAFRYFGDNTWTWYLDEIRVRQPGPMIELASVTANPNPVNPGASDVSLSIGLRNSGDGASGALTATLTTTDPDITILNGGTGSYAALAVGAEATSAAPFHISVGAGHATGDAPLKLTVTDGAHTYNLDLTVYIGVRATAHIVMRAADGTWEKEGQLFLGVGSDPENPEWLDTTNRAGTGSSGGTFTYDVDISAQSARLPPTLDHPWFLQVKHLYSGTLQIMEFSISYGATTYSALNLPWTAPDGSSSSPAVGYVMVPEPPRFEVDTVATTPTALQPGSSSVHLTVTVRNVGTATQGALSGTLALQAPTTATDVTGLTPSTALVFAAGPVGTNGTAANGSPWSFNVTAAHNDGTPLHFLLTLTDATTALTWQVPVDVPVPWPGITVESWGTGAPTLDGDGVPDPGETVDLLLTIKNTGSLVTAGPVTATLALDASSTSLATLGGTNLAFGTQPLAAGASIVSSGTVPLTLTGAQVNQKIVINATFTDGTNTWQRQITIPVYAHVGAADPQEGGSAVPDLRFAQSWSDNTTLEVRLIGWLPVLAENAAASVIVANPSTGATMRLRYNKGTLSAATLNGSSWDTATTPPSLTVTPTKGSTTALIFRVALADLASLNLNHQARMGAQADSTSSTTTVYDNLPDAWVSRAPADLALASW